MTPIPTFKNYYITTDGTLYSTMKGKLIQLKPSMHRKGYPKIILRRNGKRISNFVHRLVARTFIINYCEELQVNHINGVKTDNRVEKLEMCTGIQNISHSIRLGLSPKITGVDNHSTKLSPKDVLEIRDNVKNLTQKQLAILYKVSRSNIYMIKSYKTWIHLS